MELKSNLIFTLRVNREELNYIEAALQQFNVRYNKEIGIEVLKELRRQIKIERKRRTSSAIAEAKKETTEGLDK